MKNLRIGSIISVIILFLAGLAVAVSAAAPPNDNFGSALTLNSFPSTYNNFDNTEATSEANEPNHANASGVIHSVWYQWTATADYGVEISTLGNLDTTLAVYTGNSLSGLTQIAANDNVGYGNFYKTSRVTFIAAAGTTYKIAVAGANGAIGSGFLNLDVIKSENGKRFDFDGNGISDFGVIRPAERIWYISFATYAYDQILYYRFGLPEDITLAGDYTGDGYRAELCVWRPSDGNFYVLNRDTIPESLVVVHWGQNGDIPVTGDFDGDDVADFAVWRPSDGTFYVRQSSNGQMLARHWGVGATDVPVVADYDGDGKTDFAVRRKSGPEEGNFYILRSSDDSYKVTNFGLAEDLTIPGDFDFDGKADIAVYRPSDNTFYVKRSTNGTIIYHKWGLPGDIPLPGEYIGNPRSVFSVWRPSNGTLYVLDRFGMMHTFKFGQNGDLPIAAGSLH